MARPACAGVLPLQRVSGHIAELLHERRPSGQEALPGGAVCDRCKQSPPPIWCEQTGKKAIGPRHKGDKEKGEVKQCPTRSGVQDGQ